MQIWLQKRQFQNVRISLNVPINVGKIPTLEHVTLVFELTSFTADMLGKLIEPRTDRNNLTRKRTSMFKSHTQLEFPSQKNTNFQIHFTVTYLMNFRAKDLSFPVAAAAANSKSRLFPDNMCPRTPKRPSGDLEWSASTV